MGWLFGSDSRDADMNDRERRAMELENGSRRSPGFLATLFGAYDPSLYSAVSGRERASGNRRQSSSRDVNRGASWRRGTVDPDAVHHRR
jgi:hypothetical protein